MKKSRKKRLRRIAERMIDRRRRRRTHGEVAGLLRMTVSGFGFVTPEAETVPELDGDIFTPAKYTMNAMDGDTVRVQLLPPRRSYRGEEERGPSGKIVEIIQRNREEIVGELLAGSVFRPLDPRLPDNIIISGARRGAKRGDWVRVKLDERENGALSGHILDFIGRAGVISSDLDAVMAEYDLPPQYTEKEENEALKISPREIDRLDCTKLFTLTIDPVDAKDFDDALSVESAEQEHCVVLGVHIADVAAYVAPKSKVDEWAQERAFSCYLPGRTLPMLPKALTAKISLQQGEKALAHSVFLTVDTRSGEVLSSCRKHTIIEVDRRLDYDEVQRFIDSGQKAADWSAKVAAKVKALVELTRTMRKYRDREEKFIDLPLPEVRVICNEEKNCIESLSVKYSRESEQMVEEAMLAANQAVGRELIRRNIAGIFRTHAIPEEEKSMEFAEMMRENFNLPSGDISQRQVCRDFIAALPDDGRKSVILNLLLRAMPRAVYQIHPEIHFALGKSAYCHFTSPIRRYTDLIVHQQLWNSDCGIRTRSGRTIEKAALWCTEQEEVNDNAYFAASDRMKLRYLEEEFSRDAGRIYEGIIVKVVNAGFQVDVAELGLYGFVRKERMRGNYQRRRYSLQEDESRSTCKVGNYIYLRLDNIDFARGTANFVPAGR
ncbi:MAG: VacB/RNase II family 3'-5' exoribonuclease [Lentisphaeria bacterium]|nr:VacB/RNase II family 3'-5' exoribonuclease [Lentisphaeria bacterium]